MRKSTSINLELIKGEDGGVKFYAKQFDDLKLKIKVYDGLEEVNVDGQDIIVCIIKEDKTVIEQTKDITVEDNTIVVRLSKQATTALGKCSMEVLLRDEEGTASTTTISYMVSEKLSASIVEMIKSEDDINALNLIEEFIETSNVDMLDIKEAIKDLKATVDGAQDSIDAEYETILEALRALEGTIIENIEGKANEALTIADEAVEKVTEALNNADEVLVKVEEAKGAVGEITTEKDNALQAIESTKTEATDEIDTVKGRAINDIDEARTDSLEAIRNNGNGVVNDLNTLSDTLKADITNTGLLETNKVVRAREEAINTIDDLKDNVLGSLGEEALKVEELLNATVTEIKEQAETDLNACKDEVIGEAIRDKEEAINELNNAMRALNTLKANILEEINTNKEEAISNIGTIKDNANNELNENKAGAINELNEVKAGALVDINILKNEVDTLLNSLNEKVVESNGNIQELAGLIEEAREVAGLVRAFIDSKAVDLSNYYTKEETNTLIDEKIGLIEIPETDLTNYYTKVEVDKKINNYKGEIGYSEYKIKPEGFDEAFKRLLENPKAIYPSMKGNVVGYIMGTISRQTGTNASGARIPGVILFTDNGNFYNALRPTITNSATTNREFDIVQLKTISGGTVSSSNRNNMSYPCIIDSATGEFISGYMPNSNYHFTITDYYYSTVDIYNSDDTIAYNKCEGEIEAKITDFDECIETGDYKVNIKTGDSILNTPVEGPFKGILLNKVIGEKIYQNLISDDCTQEYKRIFNGTSWCGWR